MIFHKFSKRLNVKNNQQKWGKNIHTKTRINEKKTKLQTALEIYQKKNQTISMIHALNLSIFDASIDFHKFLNEPRFLFSVRLM